MQITFHRFYIKITSAKLCSFLAKINGYPNMNAGAFWPFLFMKFENHRMNEQWIVHERIHFRQQIELIFIFYWIIFFGERVYYRFFKKMNSLDAYLNTTFEQECYLNQHSQVYLATRKPYSFIKYFKNKRKVEFNGDGKFKIS